MKKLALALMCLVSVAFFASCDPEITNPEPTIAILAENGYLQNNQTVDITEDYPFGFIVASNPETNKQLASLVINVEAFDNNDSLIESRVWANVSLTGETSPYTHRDTLRFSRNEIVGSCVITAKVADAAGESATATIKVSLNQPAEPLTVADFDWFRQGNTQTGLEEYGLYWERNIKSPFAQIKPIQGVILYKFDSEVWDRIAYENQKAALFADGAVTASVYNNVDVNENGTYNDVIGTRMPDGTLHLMLVEMCRVGSYEPAGTPIHIYGKAK